ncbi:PREDICTED: natural killer cells antigen CD94-like [Elephantulus edwardii]|uniref:natural killer cells antigen CD94-like n=1 Tax=Elephantulus edwardii TaxID=28737 RepID=UPI0003F0E22C|nr:PREDICTED: natural killer cells antigen CD94-like [Elephantulus edwardii]
MAAVTQPSFQSTFSPGSNLELQKSSACCSCQEKWIGYKCNCYFISNEVKTWEESKKYCASQNSSLFHLKREDEFQYFRNLSKDVYWIGLLYDETRDAWIWEDGSILSNNL